MIKVWFTNFQYFHNNEFRTLAEAVEAAKKWGFNCSFHDENKIVAAWSIIGGLKNYN